MYRKNMARCQRPRVWVVESSILAIAGVVAAPTVAGNLILGIPADVSAFRTLATNLLLVIGIFLLSTKKALVKSPFDVGQEGRVGSSNGSQACQHWCQIVTHFISADETSP